MPQYIHTGIEAKQFTFSHLNFQYITARRRNNRIVEYTFYKPLKRRQGLFYFKEEGSNRMISKGSSNTCLAKEIVGHISRYRIDHEKDLLAVVVTTKRFWKVLKDKILSSHLQLPLYNLFDLLMPELLSERPLPVPKVFFDIYQRVPKSRRVKNRIKSNIAHLRERQGIYFIREGERIAYVGMGHLFKRIHAHLTPSSDTSPGVSYYKTRMLYRYTVAVIDIPKRTLSDKEYVELLRLIEKTYIQQITGLDNTIGVPKPVPQGWFDEGERWELQYEEAPF